VVIFAVDGVPVLVALIAPVDDSTPAEVMLVHRLYRSKYFPLTPPRMS